MFFRQGGVWPTYSGISAQGGVPARETRTASHQVRALPRVASFADRLWFATGVVIPLTLAVAPMTVVAQPASGSRQTAAASNPAAGLLSQPPISGIDATMAFSRMNGITPDFRPYAERSNLYQAATVYDRDAVLTREIARLESTFRTFDLDRVYTMRIGVPVEQYDPSKGGFPLGFGEGARIGVSDPVTYHSYSLAFRNAADVAFIPLPDPVSAKNFAQRFSFSTQNPQAGSAVLEMAYRLVDAPPSVQGQDVLRADILTARLITQTGQPILDFGATQASRTTVSRNADGTSELPVLKSVDVQGFRVGMPAAEAEALGSRGWKAKRGGADFDMELFFNGLSAGSPDYAACGTVVFGSPDQAAYFAGVSTLPTYSDCVAVTFEPGSHERRSDARTITGLTAQQRLSGTSADALLGAVKAKYGLPLYTRNGGTNLDWVGRDPANRDGLPIEIIADVRPGEDVGSFLLTIQEKPYQDPRPKPAAPPLAVAAPKL